MPFFIIIPHLFSLLSLSDVLQPARSNLQESIAQVAQLFHVFYAAVWAVESQS